MTEAERGVIAYVVPKRTCEVHTNVLLPIYRYPNIVNDSTTSYIWDYLSVNEEGQGTLLF